MKLSTRTRYGIRVILELAENYGKGPLQTKVIAGRQEISVKYLEQLMTLLKSARFIRSVRGSKGGYILAREPQEIKLSDLFSALEGSSIVTVECLDNDRFCARAADCTARQLWAEVQNAVITVLESKTLQELLDKTKTKRESFYQI